MTSRLILVGMVASWRLATGQAGGWSATPPAPTVGDTIWLERAIAVPAGWQVRAGKLDATEAVEPLADPAGLLATGVVARRRRPRTLEPAPPVPLEREVPDIRWLAAGEPKAVAERAIWRLRAALARAVPEAHLALDTAECLAVVERARPDAPLRELRDLLEQLDRVAFASAHGTDVAALSAMARRLARELTP